MYVQSYTSLSDQLTGLKPSKSPLCASLAVESLALLIQGHLALQRGGLVSASGLRHDE
jgi:hypothetical protein